LSSKAADANTVTLGPNDRLIGRLHIDGDLNLGGTVEGEVSATGNVDVGEAATVKASLTGRGVNISGRVEGKVTASDKLVVSRSGSLTGDVRVARLVIQDGAKFSGNVSMGAPAVAPPAEEPNVDPDSTIATESNGETQAAEKPRLRKR
jgi:cytoskeletal protein CcmA (bactofilin family)